MGKPEAEWFSIGSCFRLLFLVWLAGGWIGVQNHYSQESHDEAARRYEREHNVGFEMSKRTPSPTRNSAQVDADVNYEDLMRSGKWEEAKEAMEQSSHRYQRERNQNAISFDVPPTENHIDSMQPPSATVNQEPGVKRQIKPPDPFDELQNLAKYIVENNQSGMQDKFRYRTQLSHTFLSPQVDPSGRMEYQFTVSDLDVPWSMTVQMKYQMKYDKFWFFTGGNGTVISSIGLQDTNEMRQLKKEMLDLQMEGDRTLVKQYYEGITRF